MFTQNDHLERDITPSSKGLVTGCLLSLLFDALLLLVIVLAAVRL